MNTAAHVAAGMLMTVLLAGIAPGQEQPAFPPLRMEAVGFAGVSFEAPKGQWTVVNLGQGPKTVWVDQGGQLIEHRLVSWELGVPTETMISGGQLFVRHGGRVYRFAPQGIHQPSTGLANVTRPHQGLFVTWLCTQTETVPTTTWVQVTQWVEVQQVSTTPIAPTSSPSGDLSRNRRPNST